MSTGTIAIIIIVVVVVIIILASAIKVFPEYQRGVIFRLGASQPTEGSGPFRHHPHSRPGGEGRPADDNLRCTGPRGDHKGQRPG